MRLVKLLTGLLLAFTSGTYAKSTRSNSLLLSQVKSLTLRDGQLTSHRRVDPVPQLTCIGGSAEGLFHVDIIRCENAGSDYDAEAIQWTCKASLPPEFKLGSTEVVCEGYDSSDDPYVLKGSCAVEYTLALTDLGEEKYGKNAFQRAYRQPSGQSISGAFFTLLFWAVFITVICIFIYKVFLAPTENHGDPGNNRRLGWNGGRGGGGDDGDDDPPPPYDPQPPYKPKAPKQASSYRANSAGNAGQSSTQGQRQSDGTWRPGFWTGTAAGAAASYAASALGGNRANTQQQRPTRDRVHEYDPPQPGPSNWFGRTRDPSPPRAGHGWFAPQRESARPQTYGNGGGSSMFGSGSSSRPSSSFAAPSSSRHESTGFGGTRRR